MTSFRVVAGVVLGISMLLAVWVGVGQLDAAHENPLPLAPVRTDEFIAVIRTRGQIQARRAVPIHAPVAADLQIAWMAPASELIEQGQPMIRFDSSAAARALIERRAALERARASLERVIAEATASTEHDRREVVDARLAVEQAELGTADSEFVARLDAERARIDLRVAQQNLRQLEAEVTQREVARESEVASLRRQLEAARDAVRVEEGRIARMEVSAPISGYAIYATNNSSIVRALTGGASQPFRVGDQVYGGMNLATIPDLTSLQIDVTVEEIDRGRLRIGDEVLVRVDALPDVTLTSRLSEISPLAEPSLESGSGSFHVYAPLGDSVDSRIRPGMNGTMDVVTQRIRDATIIPARALFTRNGRPTVHVVNGGSFESVEVDILAQNPDEVAVEGLAADVRVALVDPFARDAGTEDSE